MSKYGIGDLVVVSMLDGSDMKTTVLAVKEHPRRATHYLVAGGNWIAEDAEAFDRWNDDWTEEIMKPVIRAAEAD